MVVIVKVRQKVQVEGRWTKMSLPILPEDFPLSFAKVQLLFGLIR